MATRNVPNDVVVLAGSGEVRVVRSTGEAECALAEGFRPAVVLLGAGLGGTARREFARRMQEHPSRAGIPVLAVSEDADRIRIRPVDDRVRFAPSRLEELSAVLEVLEELCDGWAQRAAAG